MSDDILIAEPLGPRVVAVQAKKDYKLFLTFDNGELRQFDAKILLDYKAFASLKKPELFRQAKAEYGTVVWPGDIDYCPDTLYAESVPVAEIVKR